MTGFDTAEFMQNLAIWAVPVLLAITLHEAAHGFVALKNGDSTAWMLGRVTLNPVKHIDPLGTVLLPMVMLAFTGFIFGYAKPVPVNFSRLNDIKWDTVKVALAGPATNLVLAVISVGVMWLAVLLPGAFQAPLLKICAASVMINFILMWLNLLPLLPLDGGRALHAVLPRAQQVAFAETERYGFIILLILLLTGLLFQILMPLLNVSVAMLNNFAPENLFYLVNNI